MGSSGNHLKSSAILRSAQRKREAFHNAFHSFSILIPVQVAGTNPRFKRRGSRYKPPSSPSKCVISDVFRYSEASSACYNFSFFFHLRRFDWTPRNPRPRSPPPPLCPPQKCLTFIVQSLVQKPLVCQSLCLGGIIILLSTFAPTWRTPASYCLNCLVW